VRLHTKDVLIGLRCGSCIVTPTALRCRSGLTERCERTPDGRSLHSTGLLAEGMMLDDVKDTIVRM